MGIEFVPFLTSGPVYVYMLLEEMSTDIQKIIITDEGEKMQHVVVDDDWRAVVPVHVLNKEAKDCHTYNHTGVYVLAIRV